MKSCIKSIIKNDCPSPIQCAINCASDGLIDTTSVKIIPFNNYGKYYLRIKICLKKVHQMKLKRYSIVQAVACETDDDFSLCNRWIPPLTFVPVALPKNTTYIEVDNCEIVNGNYSCQSSTFSTRIYGSNLLFPRSFDVAKSNNSICASNGKYSGLQCNYFLY